MLTLGAALWLRAPGPIRAALVAAVIVAMVHMTLLTDGPRAVITVAEGVVLAVGLIAVSAVALTVWTAVAHPKPPPFLADLAGIPGHPADGTGRGVGRDPG